MATMSIRVDEAEKQQAAAIAEYYGFDLSSVTRAFWKQMIREKRIPLNLGSYEPNDESLKSLAEVDKMIAENSPRFATVDDALASLKA